MVLFSILLVPFRATASFTTTAASTDSSTSSLLPQASQPQVERPALPLYFEPNVGQSDPEARFVVHAPGGLVFFTSSQVVLALKEPRPDSTANPKNPQSPITQTVGPPAPLPPSAPATEPGPRLLRTSFLDADRSAQISAGEQAQGKVNYFLGNDPSKWQSNVPTYASIQYTGLYQGIDLKYESQGGQLKSSYLVAAGADPGTIRWQYEGADQVSVDPAGNLQVRLGPPKGTAGDGATNPGNTNADSGRSQPITVIEQVPIAWQEVGGQKASVTVQYVVASDSSISFALGSYDHSRPLIIDPYLTYSTYLGGNGADDANGLAIDSAGNTYVTGSTTSTDFPISAGYQPTNGGGNDAFVTKLNATGTALIYSTYLGGHLDDYGTNIAVDAGGSAYISGYSLSSNFPTQNQYQRQNKGNEDAFITRLNSSGSALVYSSYLGGRDRDWGFAIAIDNSGNAYLAGETQPPSCALGGCTTTQFPTKNAYDSTGNGWADAVVAKFNTNSSGSTSLVYSTYLGGTDGDGAYGIAVDGSGNAYVTGVTWYRQGFPLVNPYQSDLSSTYGEDAFVTKFNSSGNGLVYSTYLGGHYRPNTGDGIDVGNSIAVDAAGSAYVTGQTSSLDFPTANAIQPAKGSTGADYDAFVTKFDPPGNTVSYSTFLGGSSDDIASKIAIDTTGNASVAGKTSSTNFPITDAYQGSNQGSTDAFVTRVNASDSSLLSSTYLGGSSSDMANGLAVNNLGDTYVAGTTTSTNFPTTAGAYRTTGNAGDSAFIAKLTDNAPKANECYGGGNPVIYTTQPVGCGDPVDTATGNYWVSYTDLSIPGRGVALQFSRTYNSLAAAAGNTSALGYGWTYSYNMYIDRDTQNNYVVHQENGSVASFRSDFSAPPRVMATLASANGQLVFTRVHGQDKFYFQTVGDPNIYRLVSVVDRNGYTTALTYTGGVLQKVTDPAGRYLQFTYTGQMLTQVQEYVGGVAGRYVVFTQDGSSDLRTAQDVGGQVAHFDNYQNHLLQTITDANNGSVLNTFDSSGRLRTQTDPMNHPPLQLDYTSGPTNSSTSITDPLGHVTVHDYDAGRLTKVTQYPGANQAVTTYSYQPGTNYIASTTDPLLHNWQSSWDGAGNLLSESDPLLHTTSYAYNGTNDLTVVTDPANHSTNYGYDQYGNLTSVSRLFVETGQMVTTQYGRDYTPGRIGDLLSMRDPNLHTWNYTYDAYGYPHSSADPYNHTSYTSYDNLGRLYNSVDANGNPPTNYSHNAYGQLVSLTNPLGYTTVYTYDNVGNLQYTQDAKDHVTTNTYNLDNQLTRVTQPDGTYSEYFYEALGRIDHETNGLGQTTVRYTYDDLSRTDTAQDTLNRSTTYSYDLAGRLISMHDPQDNYEHYLYYNDNQLWTIEYTDASTPDVIFTYNSLGLRESMSDAFGTASTVNYAYDSLDRLTSTSRNTGGNISQQVDYGYDLANNLTSIEYPPSGDGYRRTISYTFDNANRMLTLNGPDHGGPNTGPRLLATFGYDNDGNLTGMTTPVDVGATRGFGYDSANQLTNINFTLRDGGGSLVDSVAITDVRDPVGNVQNSYEYDGNGTNVITNTYGYDNLNRLTDDNFTDTLSGDTQSIVSNWGTDAANQVQQTNITPTSQPPTNILYAYDNANQLGVMTTTIATLGPGMPGTPGNSGSKGQPNPPGAGSSSPAPPAPSGPPLPPLPQIPGQQGTSIGRDVPNTTQQITTFSYTPIGNRWQRIASSGGQSTTTTYQYDQANRLVAYSTDRGDTNEQYQYDGDGLRIQKVSGGVPTSLTWDTGNALPLLLQDLGGISDSDFLYGPGGMLVGQLFYNPIQDKVGNGTKTPKPTAPPTPSTHQAAPASGDTYQYSFYNADQNGSIREMVSHNGVVELYTYDEYGNRSCSLGPCLSEQTPFGFTGQYTDFSTSGLLYMRARYYDPQTQQFLTRDPIGTANQPYAYANRNPVNYIDPTGTSSEDDVNLWERGGLPAGEEGLVVPGGGGGAGAANGAEAAAEGYVQGRLPGFEDYLGGGTGNSPSAELDSNLGGTVGDQLDAHHLIPTKFKFHPFIRRAKAAGWEQNSELNGMLLPDNPTLGRRLGLAVHEGFHSIYSRMVNGSLDYLETQAMRGSWSNEYSRGVLTNLASLLRESILRMPPGSQLR